MKNIFAYIGIILLFLSACGQKQMEQKSTETFVSTDTVKVEKDISVYNKKYHLNIHSFQDKWNIQLSKDKKEVFNRTVDKTTFKIDSLQNIEYDGVRSNKLYFSAVLPKPNSPLNFSIFYQTNKIGQIDFIPIQQK